jgi:hypothetical protein
MKLPTFAGLALACLSLGACSTLAPLTGNPVADAKTVAANAAVANSAQLDSLGTLIDKINTALLDHCSGSVNLNFAPPAPPGFTGNLQCTSTASQGGMVPLASIQALANGTATLSTTGKNSASGSLTVSTPNSPLKQ